MELPCVRCGKAASRLCSGCCIIAYCGTTCQYDDWIKHESECVELAAEFPSGVGVPGDENTPKTTTTAAAAAAEDGGGRAARVAAVRNYWDVQGGNAARLAFMAGLHPRAGSVAPMNVLDRETAARVLWLAESDKRMLGWRLREKYVEVFDMGAPASAGPMKTLELSAMPVAPLMVAVPFEDVVVYAHGYTYQVTVAVFSKDGRRTEFSVPAHDRADIPKVSAVGSRMLIAVGRDVIAVDRDRNAAVPIDWESRKQFIIPADWDIRQPRIYKVEPANAAATYIADANGNEGPVFFIWVEDGADAAGNHTEVQCMTIVDDGMLTLHRVGLGDVLPALTPSGELFSHTNIRPTSGIIKTQGGTINWITNIEPSAQLGQQRAYTHGRLVIVEHARGEVYDRGVAASVGLLPTSMTPETAVISIAHGPSAQRSDATVVRTVPVSGDTMRTTLVPVIDNADAPYLTTVAMIHMSDDVEVLTWQNGTPEGTPIASITQTGSEIRCRHTTIILPETADAAYHISGNTRTTKLKPERDHFSSFSVMAHDGNGKFIVEVDNGQLMSPLTEMCVADLDAGTLIPVFVVSEGMTADMLGAMYTRSYAGVVLASVAGIARTSSNFM